MAKFKMHDTYSYNYGRNLEEGHTDWAAQDKFSEFARRTGLDQVAPGVTHLSKSDMPDSAHVAMARSFAESGGSKLLGFDSVADYRDAQAAQNDMTRAPWMAKRIVQSEQLPDTSAIHDRLTGVIVKAFDHPLPVGRGMESAGEKVAGGALRDLRAEVIAIRIAEYLGGHV